jgi:signal transduction histidine kinase
VSPRRRELLAAAAGAALGGGVAALAGDASSAIAAAVALGGSLAVSRRRPRSALLVATVVLVAIAPQGGPPDTVSALAFAHAFCAGRRVALWGGLAGVLVLIGASEVGVAVDHGDAVPYLFLPLTAWAAGRALGEREKIAERLAERVRELDEEREAHAELSVRYERAQIASELHDIVAHAISVMVVQASAGQRLAAHDADLTAEAFTAIADAARQAEQDMGRLVELLGNEEAIGPPPDLALVEELVERSAGSGLDVTLRLEGEREGLSAPIVEAACRVVREGLTNALRYASGTPVSVLVNGGGDALVVEVENGRAGSDAALTGTGTGNGLRGLRERVGACGGRLEAGPTSSGGWRLSARLPRTGGPFATTGSSPVAGARDPLETSAAE